ncbi:tail fiber domain-containing protein [Paracoccus aminovorans]|uniref:tail fiber domain-containing protein n=1 Tax=Paracoccus aminovorans TaxID=34004 RepID=UPI0009EB2127|nr:tail fiber domain-containing protein [Paracoccus aminovorans]
MGKRQPSAPDPVRTAAAQTGTNVSTAVANAFLNNVNQETPYGSLNYNATGNYSWTDPSTNQTYNIPTFTATQSLTPAGERLQDATMATQQNLADTAQTASGRLNSMLSSPVDLSNAPAAGATPTMQTVGAAKPMQTSIAGAGNITRTYGTDFSQDRAKVEQAIMDRAAGGLENDRKALEQRLADQGIAIGSAAYQSAMDDYNRGVNDMRTSAILAGGQEQSRMAGLEAQRAQFQNAAQNQQWTQNAQQAQFRNSANQQNFQNSLSQAGFNNDARSQQFDLQNTARNQYLQETYANRNQGLNEILGLMNGSQVQNPNFVNTGQNNIANTDYAGIVQQDFQNRMGQYQNRMGLFNNLGSGIGSLFALSDRDAKTDIEKVGKTDDGQNVYAYRYKHEGEGGPIHMGLMAQEVEKKRPEAVVKGADGLRRVNYGIALGV